MNTYRTNIREHSEGLDVSILEEDGELFVIANNQGGYDKTAVNIKDLLAWVFRYKPEYAANVEKNTNETLLSDVLQWLATYRPKKFQEIIGRIINA